MPIAARSALSEQIDHKEAQAITEQRVKNKTSIAIFHENFAQNGGAERVVESLARLLPEADLFSSLVVQQRLSSYMRKRAISCTWMQHLPLLKSLFRHYFALYPFAVASTRLDSYGLVLSSCFGFAKGIRKAPGALHVCYCHTPPRWLWRTDDFVEREHLNSVARAMLFAFNCIMRPFDVRSSLQPDYFIANSEVVAQRIFRFYGRQAHVIPPPVEVERFTVSDEPPEDFFLVVSRLIAYKRIDLAIEACNKLNVRLKIVGEGPELRHLQNLAGPTIEFLGRLPDCLVAQQLSQCRALLFPGEEDFGIAPLEAAASGRPVVAFAAGGALETVIDGTTGVLFPDQTSESLAHAMLKMDKIQFNPQELREHAMNFSTTVFYGRMIKFLKSLPEVGVMPSLRVELNRAERCYFVPEREIAHSALTASV
jgi:glycosyltransferase involved in cell wall biosynthesis